MPYEAMTREEIIAAVNEAWDLSGDRPVPREVVRCACGSNTWAYQRHEFHPAMPEGEPHRMPMRCVVLLKCVVCSQIARPFGIAITVEDYERMVGVTSGEPWAPGEGLPGAGD